MLLACLGKGHDGWCSWGPDAPIRSISVSPATVDSGDEITIKAKIEGIGGWNVACSNFTLKFYFDGTYIGCYKDRITKGDTWWVSFKYTIPAGTSPGSHQIKAEETISGTVRSIVVVVEKLEGKATITEFDAPSEFKPGVSFTVTVRIRNDGGDDTLYIRLKNKDTGAVLKDVSHAIPSGDQWRYAMTLNITQTTDFHGRIEVGHIE